MWTTGWSLVTAQYAWAAGDTYVPTLMLWTIGAKTRPHALGVSALLPGRDDLVIRGSNGGGPTDPHWVHNVRANPQAWIRVNAAQSARSARTSRGRRARAHLRGSRAAEPLDRALPEDVRAARAAARGAAGLKRRSADRVRPPRTTRTAPAPSIAIRRPSRACSVRRANARPPWPMSETDVSSSQSVHGSVRCIHTT